MEGFLVILAIVVIGFILFCIYFIFKLLQFVIVAVNLYKKMVKRQDAIIKILLDIRDKTKSVKQKEIIEQLEEESSVDDSYIESINKYESGIDNSSSDLINNYENEDEDKDNDVSEEPLEFCYHCGAELKTKVKTCPKCGKKL